MSEPDLSAAVFETKRLVVRRYELTDTPFVLDMYSRWDVQQFLGPAPRPIASIDEAAAAIQRWRAISEPNSLLGFWAIVLRTGEQVGTVMLKLAPLSSEQKPPPLSDDYEVGWHLHPQYWGHGYATESTMGALQRAYDAGVDEVLALIHPDNKRSKQVAERLGMQHQGVTHRYYSMDADLYVARAAR